MNKNDTTIHYLLANKWRCKDGTILHSKHRHDYVSHTAVDGTWSFTDGGLDYIRHSGNMESMCVYTNDPHEKIRENFEWLSYGKNYEHYPNGIRILLKDITDDHLAAIIETQQHLSDYIMKIFTDELTYRSKL